MINREREYDVIIAGAGASGLACAITLKRQCPNWDVVIFEKKDKPLKKVAASGNGRCNISNVNCEDNETVMDFLASVGIITREEEEGRLYPYSEDARDVVKVLLQTARGLGIQIITEMPVTSVEPISFEDNPRGGFNVYCLDGRERFYCENLVLSTGGKSYSAYGTTGDGYIIARRLGHNVTKLSPALTAVEVSDNIKSLKGVRVKCRATLICDNEVITQETGEVQFRDDSLSGICIMNLSDKIKPFRGLSPEDSFRHYIIRLDLTPDFKSSDIKSAILAHLEIPGFDERYAVRTLVREELANYIVRREGVFFARWLDEEVTKEEMADFLADELSDFRLHVKGLKGWNEAQVTKGGVPLDEINPDTMESLKVPGLYITGELMDYTGRCGGYNLHNAWLTGIKAGRNLVR